MVAFKTVEAATPHLTVHGAFLESKDALSKLLVGFLALFVHLIKLGHGGLS